MRVVNVGIVGFGTVGAGVVKTLLAKRNILQNRVGVSINLSKIADKNTKPRKGVKIPKNLVTKDVDSVIKDPNVDIIVELIGGINPAKEIILNSLSLGKHVVTANKALLAQHGDEIFGAALRFNSCVGFEASVGGGIPIINILKNRLVSNRIDVIYGILNGTSNYVLSKMSDEDCDFNEALRGAKEKGIAESNPALDISGIDSCHKLAILTLLGFGISVKPKHIYTEGIGKIEPLDIQYAKDWGYAVKPLAIAKRQGSGLDLRVHPTLIPARRLLSNVKNENNAIFIKGDMVEEALFYGKGAGSFPAASSVVSDIVEIAKAVDKDKSGPKVHALNFDSGVKKVFKIEDLYIRYYLRFFAIDKPGVLAGISSVLAKNKISIATVTQKERKKGQPVPIVMLTHDANEGSMNKALKEIDKLPFIAKRTVKIRIER